MHERKSQRVTKLRPIAVYPVDCIYARTEAARLDVLPADVISEALATYRTLKEDRAGAAGDDGPRADDEEGKPRARAPKAGAARAVVSDIAPTPIQASTVPEPAPTRARPVARCADEVLRNFGHPDYQHGIVLSASATLTGEATLVATVE